MMEQAQEQVTAKIGGIPVSVKGLNMVVFMALVAVTSFTIYYLSVIVSREHALIAESLDKQNDTLKEQNYILLADEHETKLLKQAYRMPQSLREKMSGIQP